MTIKQVINKLSKFDLISELNGNKTVSRPKARPKKIICRRFEKDSLGLDLLR